MKRKPLKEVAPCDCQKSDMIYQGAVAYDRNVEMYYCKAHDARKFFTKLKGETGYEGSKLSEPHRSRRQGL